MGDDGGQEEVRPCRPVVAPCACRVRRPVAGSASPPRGRSGYRFASQGGGDQARCDWHWRPHATANKPGHRRLQCRPCGKSPAAAQGSGARAGAALRCLSCLDRRIHIATCCTATLQRGWRCAPSRYGMAKIRVNPQTKSDPASRERPKTFQLGSRESPDAQIQPGICPDSRTSALCGPGLQPSWRPTSTARRHICNSANVNTNRPHCAR